MREETRKVLDKYHPVHYLQIWYKGKILAEDIQDVTPDYFEKDVVKK